MEVRNACEQLPVRLRVPRVCPRLYPASGFVRTGDPEDDRSLRTPNAYSRDLYELTFNNGNTRGHLHWVVGVGTPRAFSRTILSGKFNVTRGTPRRRGHIRTGRGIARLYEFRDGRGGPNSGHVIAAIRHADVIVYGSVHGFRHRDLAIALGIDASEQLAPR